MIPANKDSSYEIKEVEKHLIHVLLETRAYDTKSGRKLSKPMVRSFYYNDFMAMTQTVEVKGGGKKKRNAFARFDVVRVVHDPTFAGVENEVSKVEKSLDTDNSNESFDTIEKYVKHLDTLEVSALQKILSELTDMNSSEMTDKDVLIDAIVAAKQGS